ncbi:hypothetical protein MMC11_001571 [Xylographa trunciseda]|nr:hypothetical protein [Xylographa trunciseda]
MLTRKPSQRALATAPQQTQQASAIFAIFANKMLIFVLCPLILNNMISSESLNADLRCAEPAFPAPDQIDHHLEVRSATKPCAVASRSRRKGPLPVLNEHDYGRYLQYKRRPRKECDKETGKEIWPDFVEEAFQAALLEIPRIGKRKTPLMSKNGVQKSSGRNELLAHKIELLTGVKRTRKQISSHIQVLQAMIKDPKWLSFVKSEPPAGAMEYDSVRGKLIFKDSSQSAGHSARSTTTNFRGETLPPPTLTLGSSLPECPYVQKIELNMSVFPQANQYQSEPQACHIYTRIQDEMGAQPKVLQDDSWRHVFPDLANIYSNSSSPRREIILLEANLELMKDYCPPKSSLAIQLFADVCCPGLGPPWMYRTRFYMKGNLSKECSGQLDTPQLTDPQRSRVIIPLSSKWWVQLFYNIMERRGAIKAAGDMQGLYQYENETRRDISELSVMQEIFASSNKGGNGDPADSAPVFILLWKFRQTLPGEAATTSWRKIHQYQRPLQAPTESLSPQLAQPPLALDPDLQSLPRYTYISQPYTESLQSHTQHETRWDEYGQMAGDLHAMPHEGVMTDFKTESPVPSRLAGYPTDLIFQGQGTQTYSMGDHTGSHYAPESAPYQSGHEALQSLVHDLEGNNFADPLQQSNYDLHHFESHEQAAHTLTHFAAQPVALEISPQSASTEFASQSTDADFASQSTVDSFSTDVSTNYLPHTTDPNLDIDLASWNIQLDYNPHHEHMTVPLPSPSRYEHVGSISPTVQAHALHPQDEHHLLMPESHDPHAEPFHTQLPHSWHYLPHDQDHSLPAHTADDYPQPVFHSPPPAVMAADPPGLPPAHDQCFKLEDEHWEQAHAVASAEDAPAYAQPYQHALDPAHYHQLMQQEEEALQGLAALPQQVYTHEQHEHAGAPELLVGMLPLPLPMPGQIGEQVRQHPQGFEGMEPGFSEGLDKMGALNDAMFGGEVVRKAAEVSGVEECLGRVGTGEEEEQVRK